MEFFNINNWKWNITEQQVLYPWFVNFKNYIQEGLIKSNSERDVFRVVGQDGKPYIVKYSHPSSIFQKTRSSFSPKLAAEYESIKLLEESGIPVVNACGWGSCGSESMLVTEEVMPSESVRKYWFSEAVKDEPRRKDFLAKFADFLKTFLDAGMYHPDFHPGNILIKTDTMEFVLVDPYGVEKMGKDDKGKIFEMLCILGAFRGEIHDEEGRELLGKVSGVRCQVSGEEDQWTEILKHEALKSERLWQKRRDKAVTDVRNSQIFGDVRIRKSIYGEFLVDPETITELENSDIYISKELSMDEAEKEWLGSLRLQIHRLPHQYPVAWKSSDSGNDKLFFEREINTILSEEEIDKRIEISGIEQSRN